MASTRPCRDHASASGEYLVSDFQWYLHGERCKYRRQVATTDIICCLKRQRVVCRSLFVRLIHDTFPSFPRYHLSIFINLTYTDHLCHVSSHARRLGQPRFQIHQRTDLPQDVGDNGGGTMTSPTKDGKVAVCSELKSRKKEDDSL
jgi:hypothetical protein